MSKATLQAVLQKPAMASQYLFTATPQWITAVSQSLAAQPTALRVGAASAAGALGYGACATIALLLQLPCALAQRYAKVDVAPQAEAAPQRANSHSTSDESK